MALIISPIKGLPIIKPGDNLAAMLWHALPENQIELQDGDILVITQKIVSKAEGRLVNLAEVVISPQAEELAEICEKDARLVELILRESNEILRTRAGTIIVEHRLGFICANAGIDHSNVAGEGDAEEEWVLLLPENPTVSAAELRAQLEGLSEKHLGVLVIDSHGRAWRIGTVGMAIGFSGIPGVMDLRGRFDLHGYQLRITQIGVADELAAAASLMMGQAAEAIPAVHVRGFPYPLRDGSLSEVLRPRDLDLFR